MHYNHSYKIEVFGIQILGKGIGNGVNDLSIFGWDEYINNRFIEENIVPYSQNTASYRMSNTRDCPLMVHN